MKIIIPVILVAGLIACQPKSEGVPQDTHVDTSGTHEVIDAPIASCYQGIKGLDTFQLNLESFKNVITGRLSYLFHEKDRSTGEIKGIMQGDTLIADYTFNAEGTTSVREVAFLI